MKLLIMQIPPVPVTFSFNTNTPSSESYKNYSFLGLNIHSVQSSV